jgi:copper chaperone CopZ
MMKKNLLILMTLAGFVSAGAGSPAFAEEKPKPAEKTAVTGGKSIKVAISGMVCAFCAQGITKKFKAMPEVKDVDVNLDTKVVTIALNEGKSLADESITTVIKDSGYKVVKIDRM